MNTGEWCLGDEMFTMVDCKSGGPISSDLRCLRLDHACKELDVGYMMGVFRGVGC